MRLRIRKARSGFTLVELMVAAALTILIMTVISMAFQSGLTTLSHLRSMGDLAERLRIAQDRLRDDLEAEHFDRGTALSPLKLSDVRYDLIGTGSGFIQPSGGYFRLEQHTVATLPTPPLSLLTGNIYESRDSLDLFATRSNMAFGGSALEFTITRPLTHPDKLLTGQNLIGPSLQQQSLTDTDLSDQYIARWARVRWELVPSTSINGIQLYTLHRNVRLLANRNSAAYPVTVPLADTESQFLLSFNPTTRVVHDIVTATQNSTVQPRPAIVSPPIGSANYGSDIVLTNVVSFEVKPMWTADLTTPLPYPPHRDPRRLLPVTAVDSAITRNAPTLPGPSMTNSDYPFDDLPQNINAFDTSAKEGTNNTLAIDPTTNPPNAATIPFRARITGVQIKIRVYEPKNNMTRQSTIIVKL
jgi:Prokaryotic N-terminal methylation motif